MAFTSVNIAAIYNTSAIVIPTIRTATFSSPTALGQIVISSITGNFTSYTVTRGGTNIATGQTGATYTDTSLANNTQYTYTIVPYIGGIKGTAFTTITNPKTGTTAGTIYTLGSPATLSLTYAGGTSSTTTVSFTWIGTLNNFSTLSIQTSTAAATGVLSTPAYNAATQTYTTGASYSVNQLVTLYAFAVNVDGIGSGVAAAQGSVSTCTLGSCNAPTFSSTTATGTTLVCTGTFSKVYITYSGGTASPASGTTVTVANSISQAYTSMTGSTAYTFNCFPVNALNYQRLNAASASVTTLASGGTLLANSAITFTITDANTGWGTSANLFNRAFISNETSGSNWSWGSTGYPMGNAGGANTSYSTTVSGSTVYGPWVQANLTSTTISLSSFSFFDWPNGNGTGWSAPRQINIVGSNNNSTWTIIYTIPNATPYDNTLHTYSITGTIYYKYIRFIFTSINGNDASYIRGVKFSGYVI